MKKSFNIALLSTLFLINTTYSAQVAMTALRRIAFTTAAFSPTLGVLICEEIGVTPEDSDQQNLFKGVGKRVGHAARGCKKLMADIAAGMNETNNKNNNSAEISEPLAFHNGVSADPQEPQVRNPLEDIPNMFKKPSSKSNSK